MQSVLVVDCYFIARSDVAEREEQHVAVNSFHVRVRFAGVIDVVRAVAATAAIQTPATIDVANPQLGSMRPPTSFKIRYSCASVFGNLLAARKSNRRETTLAVDWRFPNRKTAGKFEKSE